MSTPKPFSALVQEWHTAYAAFFAALNALPADKRETAGLCGTWNARQMVAHLAGWHYEAVRCFAEFAAGDTSERHYDDDSFNALQVEAREHLSWGQTLDDLREVMSILDSQARDLPDDIAARDHRYSDWLVGLRNDADLHRAQVEAWL